MAEEEEVHGGAMSKVTDLSHWIYFFLAEEDRNTLDAWMRGGKCFMQDQLVEVFNPPVEDDEDRPSKTARIITIEAKKYCNGSEDGMTCSVKKQCLNYAVENRIYYGVWGGTTVRERRRIASERAVKIRGKE